MREIIALFGVTVTVLMFVVAPCIGAPPNFITATERSPFVHPMCSDWPSMQVAQSRFPGCCGAGYFECRFRNGSHEGCIPLHQFHDGHLHCEDGSDEACFPGQIRCGNVCADLIHLAECIRYPHCPNDVNVTGEFTPPSPIVPSPVIGVEPPTFCKLLNHTLCGSLAAISCRGYGDCVYGASLMDGKRDCFDGSDEDPQYAALFKSIGTRPVFPVQLPSPLTTPTTPVFATVGLPTLASSNGPANKNPTVSQELAIGPLNAEQAIRPIIPILHALSSEKGEMDGQRPSGLDQNNLPPLAESEIPPPKEPFGLPNKSFGESFGKPSLGHINQSSRASIGLGIGIGVGQLTVPNPEIIRPANEHWNMKYVPLPSSQPNSSRFYSRKPIKATKFPFLSPATDAKDEPAIVSTTVEAVAAQTDGSTLRESTPRRRLDLGRYYLWPNQDGWVVFPPNGDGSASQGLFHERLPAQPGGVFVVKPAKVAPIADRRVTPIAGSNQLLWTTARTVDDAVELTSKPPAALNGQISKNRQLDTIYLLEPDESISTTTISTHHPTIDPSPAWTVKEAGPISPESTDAVGSSITTIEPKPEKIVPENEHENEHIRPVVPVFVPPIRSGALTAERVIGGAMLPLPPVHRSDLSPSTSAPCLSTETSVSSEADWLLPLLAPIVPVNAPSSEGYHQTLETQTTSTTITLATTVIITEIETTTVYATTTRSTIPEAEGLFEWTSTTKPDEFVDLVEMKNCTETTTNETETETTTIPPGQGTMIAVGSENSTVPEAEAEETTLNTTLLTTQPPVNAQAGLTGSYGNEIIDSTLSGSTSLGEQGYLSTDRTQALEQLTTTVSSIYFPSGFVAPVIPAIIRPIPESYGRVSDAGQIVGQTSTHPFVADSDWRQTSTTREHDNVTTVLQPHNKSESTQANFETTETVGNETSIEKPQDLKQTTQDQGRWPVSIAPMAVNRTSNIVENVTVINANVSAVSVPAVSPYKPVSDVRPTEISMPSSSTAVLWARTGVEAAAISQNENELSALNCTQRVRELSRRFAPSPSCDCPPGQMRDVNRVCRRTDVATFRARLTRFCGARAHLDTLTGNAQAAIVFAKLAATLPNISVCIRQSAGALVIVNAQCGTSCTFDELQQKYYATHKLMSEIDLKIAELEESACYQPSLNDCDGHVAECVPLGLHYVCECLPGVTANATRGADGAPRCRDDQSWRNACTRVLGICLLYWLIGALLFCALAALALFLWMNLCESGAAAWNDCYEKYYEEKRPRRLPTGQYSAYAAIYRIMQLVSNLVDEEQLATRRISPRAFHSTVDQTIDETEENEMNDEADEDVGKWLERPSDERFTPPPSDREPQVAAASSILEPVTAVNADEKTPVPPDIQQREPQKGKFVAKRRKDSLASEGSTTETLWENYQHHPSMPLKMNGRQKSEDSIDYFIRQREEQLRQTRQAAQPVQPSTVTTTPSSTAVVLAEAARKVEAEIKREVEGGVPPRVAEKTAHFRELPAAAPHAPPPSQTEAAAPTFRAKRRSSDASQKSAASTVASRQERAESRGTDAQKSSAHFQRRRMSDESETRPTRHLSRQFSDGAPPPERRVSRATLELAEHRALRRQAMYNVQPLSTPSKSTSNALESPIESVGSLPPIHPSRRPLAGLPPPSESQKPRRDGTSKREKSAESSAKEPVKATHRSMVNRKSVSPSSLASPKSIQRHSVVATSKSPVRRPQLNAQSKNESALTDLAELPISLSYPSIREKYAANEGVLPDDALLPEDMDLDLPGPYVRPAKTRGTERASDRKKTRNSGKSGSSSQSSSTIARKIASRRAAAPSEQKPTLASVYGDSPAQSARSEELTASARERLERLRAQFDERVHSGCLKNRQPWDGSPSRSRDSPASSGGLGGAATRFGGSQLSMTGLQMRRARSSGDFSTGNGNARRTAGRRRPVAQRRVVTFNETSIELGERSRSMMDVPRTRQRDKPLAADVAEPPRQLSRAERDEASTKADAIRLTNEFHVDDGQRGKWLERFQGTIESKSWLDYD